MQKSSTLIRSVMTMPSSESYLVWHPMTLWISVPFILTEKPDIRVELDLVRRGCLDRLFEREEHRRNSFLFS